MIETTMSGLRVSYRQYQYRDYGPPPSLRASMPAPLARPAGPGQRPPRPGWPGSPPTVVAFHLPAAKPLALPPPNVLGFCLTSL
jgi:hypothetical protein